MKTETAITARRPQDGDALLVNVAESVPAIGDDAVSAKLLADALNRRIAGQFGMITPLGLLGWMATDIAGGRSLLILIMLQIVAQFAIAGSAVWLRRAVDAGRAAPLRQALWMLCEAASGAIWAAALLLVGPMIGGSDAALTSWITILVTMAVSALLAAPYAGIVFPLLGGFAAALTAGLLLPDHNISAFSVAALICLTIALFIVAKAVNLQARTNCRAEIGVARLSKRLEEELRRTSWLSRHDSLTGLLNRSALQEAFADWGDARVSVILVDIDHFKAINDGFGHMQGDAVIAAVGGCLSRTLAGVTEGSLAARWGGEEFIVAVPGYSAAEARATAEILRLAVSGLTQEDWPARLSLTVSLGIASGPAAAFPSLFLAADRAMYDAKALGRNRVVCAAEAGSEPRTDANPVTAIRAA